MKTTPLTVQQLIDAAHRGIDQIPVGCSSVAPLAGGILDWQQVDRSLSVEA